MPIQVKNIAGLETYGTSIHTFAGRFEEVASDTVREFNTSLEGEKAEAINAFFEKLNQIQQSVFNDAPEAIRTYGQQVFTFTGELEGLGFSSLAFTDDDSISTLVNSLEGNQKDEINDVKSKLTKALQHAVDVMGEGDATISNFDSTVEDLISGEVQARKETHAGITTAHETLESGVANSADRFKELTVLTQNAKAVTSIPAKEILQAIQRGDMTADKVEYLSAVYTPDDVEIVKVMISESTYDKKEDYFTDLGNAEVGKASLSIMMIVAHRLEQAVDGKEVEGLRAFFETLSNRQVEEVQDYTAKLSAGIDTIVDGINKQGADLIVTLPKDYNEAQYQSYLAETESSKERLKALKESSVRYGKLNNILQFMNEGRFGEKEIKLSNVSLGNGEVGEFSATIKRNIKEGSFTIRNGELEFQVQDLGMDRENVSETWSTSSKSELDKKELVTEIDNLRKQKDLLWVESGYHLTKDIVSQNPVAGFFWDIMESAASTPDEKEALKAVGEQGLNHVDDVTFKRFDNLKKYGRKLASSGLDYFEKSEEIDRQIAENDRKILAEQFDIGGFAIKEGESSYKTIIGDSRYDFEGNLHMADLEKNGLRGHYFRKFAKGSETDLEVPLKELEKVDDMLRETQTSGSYDKNMKSLFMGEGKQSLANFSGEQLEKGMEALKKLTANSDNYSFLPDNYGDSEKTYFNELVGIGAQAEK